MRIGFVHTYTTLMERFRTEMSMAQPHVDCFHVVNEGLLQDLLRGEDRAAVYRRTVRQLLLAADNGADLVVFTCSTTSPAVDLARQMCPVPILKLDDPMAAEAVRVGRRIAVLCTNTSTPGPAAALLRQHAAAQGREVLVETVVRPEAHTALFAGDPDRHDYIIMNAAQDVAPRSDVLLLVHVNMLHLQSEVAALGKPVLTAPGLLMTELARRLAPTHASV